MSSVQQSRGIDPGQFLVGHPLYLIPEPDIQHIPRNRLDHWQELQNRTNMVMLEK